MYVFEGGINSKKNSSIGTLSTVDWGSPYKGLELNASGNSVAGGSVQTWVTENSYHDGTNWRYARTAAGGVTGLSGNTWQHYGIASGTAGNVQTLTQLLATGLGFSFALQGATTQSGTGITFPAAQSASTNVNTLDDYEEGSWTPVDSSGAGLSFSSVANCRYVKIGRSVFINLGVLTYPVNANATQCVIGGLPFTCGDDAGNWSFGGQPGFCDRIANVGFMGQGNATTLWGYEQDGTGLTNAEMSGKTIYGYSTHYFAS